MEPAFVDERRLIACPIFRASEAVHLSSSGLELPLSTSGDGSDEAFSTMLNEEVRVLPPISRSGDMFSDSEEYALMGRGTGEPSDRLERAPTANRDEPLRSTDAFGGDGMGEDPLASSACAGMGAEKVGGDSSIEEVVGVPSTCSGVFWNSARVPFSVSSLQRTPRLVFDGDLFLIGENWTPFFTPPIFLLRGDDFTGDELRCGASVSIGKASGRIGDGAMMLTGFRLFGVPL
jgi:hypothetical protein